MNSLHYFISIFWLINLLASIIQYQVAVCSTRNVPNPINVTKHFSFPDFNLTNNPLLVHSIRLIGNAKFSTKKGALQFSNEAKGKDIKHQPGRGIYSFPIRLFDPSTNTPASFETAFSFQVNNSTKNQTGFGGGSALTFIIVPDEFTVGGSGPLVGMLNGGICENDYKALVIDFVTRMKPESGDPTNNESNNLGTTLSTRIINVSDVGLPLKDGFVHYVWISYDGPKKIVDIRLGAEKERFPFKPIFSESMDLSPYLNEYMFVGFSASTGNNNQIHSILSWNFTSTSQAFLRFPSAENCKSKISVQNTTTTEKKPDKKKSRKDEIPRGFFIFMAAVALSSIVGFSFILRRRGNAAKPNNSLEAKVDRPSPPNKPCQFTFSQFSFATRSFSEVEFLGSDTRGQYYKGKLSNGSSVAVKRFSGKFLNTYISYRKRLLKEIATISNVRHPNLVLVKGWCEDNNEIMVAYDFVHNGSLDKWLFGTGVLPWARRLKVIKDVADGLNFLHTKKLAHKNLKCSSVFLDLSLRAVLGDFGFVLIGAESKKFESLVSIGADVFEFGVLVLEVVAGRRRVEEEKHEEKAEERNLLDFAWNLHQTNEKVKLVDRRMGPLINMEQAIRVLEIGLLCTLNEKEGRPSMQEVVEFLLNRDKPIPYLPTTSPGALLPNKLK
ncbi:hypothetical protein TanjilG_32203 [Lupinus angustifolius]|uniref:Protein kinase domain-containing protein n=1 Tax=Lupinus angustifolius TaxID=3871 RepID=A0A1J7ID71_LUPAN|nr:PREDICTED: probable L-type lectin-domain containing receptor kinase S.7 [Lupinus angustifolius]OIW16532.1 hypothetical protein TanjilG_32203 [Lupinus angustifolius]